MKYDDESNKSSFAALFFSCAQTSFIFELLRIVQIKLFPDITKSLRLQWRITEEKEEDKGRLKQFLFGETIWGRIWPERMNCCSSRWIDLNIKYNIDFVQFWQFQSIYSAELFIDLFKDTSPNHTCETHKKPGNPWTKIVVCGISFWIIRQDTEKQRKTSQLLSRVFL